MPIPSDMREEIASDPFMRTCIYASPEAPNHDCRGRITWEHSYLLKGRSLQEKWAIVPCCQAHNSGEAMVKTYNKYRAIIRADIEELTRKYPKTNWHQEYKYLISLYDNPNRKS